MSASTGWRLPETDAGWVTDGGLETDLIFHRGLDLPDFAAFPLLDADDGRAVLADYYLAYADVAARAGAGLLLETPTWRANADWGARLGYDAHGLARINRDAVAFLRDLADGSGVRDTLVVGALGPRGDGYLAGDLDADRYAGYHRPQLAAFADAGADLATAYTLTTVAEATGIVRAAQDVGLPVAISFTVETDGRLPDGTALGASVESLDTATGSGAAHLLVNCAHPDHVTPGLDPSAPWSARISGLRVNSSRLTHAELDEAEELDEGDLAELASGTRALADALPGVRILGGCCGTDARHVAAIWDGWSPVAGAGHK
ncbi:homocysteine S-methyltransferase [Nocardioides alpinus]|uniref:Homocysteine S-methyltransferase n=1 Tax=Nocardioides alpinus TaxID=748909 RepID=A0A1I1A0W8_9ACTN|nr:homocysteine S-methyltransferase family protein [Nocardioides alpinus]PKH42215.1 homocysteine S-methyltransferase [Nocardioides alpinus]SFB31212.1 homocysteine S-methyltransferase [Nocardioides alpinus]